MIEQIQRMIDWMEGHVKDFSLGELATYMGYSPYYCSFTFHRVTGMSIRRYLLLRRLYLSTIDLANHRRIIDVAIDYNYSSQEAYSRAFKTVFGINPREFQRNKMPVQSFAKLTIQKGEEWYRLNISRKMEVQQLQNAKSELFDKDVLNILNGQAMYEEFTDNKLMGESDYAPFNEAMCINAVTSQVFDEAFIQTRAGGHHDSVDNYRKKVIDPLEKLLHKKHMCIVLWFGEDMFCQMNLLTILAYLEQSGYAGKVLLNSFREDEFIVSQTELKLGHYASVYNDVLVNRVRPSAELLPVMYQAIELYFEMQKENNAVVKYIANHKDVPVSELVKRLFKLFPTIGYGDSQYIELIHKTR
ncbi:AraC family transcriptional regulator [uncultured Brevibacillus sp.]|uniref:helix-turn-helix domain-containing protein n=1 Tax=uncultured Brevibacillus sp. TaxID=169970 RepID=UPI002593EB5A|nr:AraC family transcriptional regulator [uncultured Brevibacillus sp.]